MDTLKELVKKILSPQTRSNLGKSVEMVDLTFARFFSRFAFTSSLYYCFFSSKFHREHRAVLLGRLRYYHTLRKEGFNHVLLRRNIHRLEKGLIMRPRRDIFGEEYIRETVDCYVNSVRDEKELSGGQKWAHDVLSEYFSIVGSTEKIDAAKNIFYSVKLTSCHSKYVPYPRHSSPNNPIGYDQLMVLFQRRRSIRWYLDVAVEAGLVEKAIDAASLAPSACNRQPYSFKVINNAENATRIADCAMGTAGFSQNIPCLIAVVGDLSAYPAERDRHVIYIDGALAAMQLMLAFETLGLSTCPINWPDIEEREKRLSQELGLQYHQRTVMLLAVGYADPDGGVPYSQKKSSKELIVSN